MKNSFGNIFRITTWGESHGKAIGVVVDGCPAGLQLNLEEMNQELLRRQGGNSAFVTARKEPDQLEILSGMFEGKTTGAPISLMIWNQDADSSKYEPIKHLLRPGHANSTYLQKYGIFDWRGGGRASARETACRVAAGAIAKQLIRHFGISVCAYTKQIHHVIAKVPASHIQSSALKSPLFCPDPSACAQMQTCIQEVKASGDSVGGVVEFLVEGMIPGLGDPIYEKLEGNLAKALMTLPATKGFEIGEGFSSTQMLGSEHNDLFGTHSNHAGGTLGGISTGQPLIGRVAFKPTSSIRKPQETLTVEGKKETFNLPDGSRHDPCVVPRAVPIVEAMVALVLADAILMNRTSQL
ncbi:MAG: chorismate synthase [Waddliaceae bacterium]